jgi:hypothetical protein
MNRCHCRYTVQYKQTEETYYKNFLAVRIPSNGQTKSVTRPLKNCQQKRQNGDCFYRRAQYNGERENKARKPKASMDAEDE